VAVNDVRLQFEEAERLDTALEKKIKR